MRADLQLFQQFHYVHEVQTVETVGIDRVIATTQLKLGVNEKLVSKLLLQVARIKLPGPNGHRPS